MGIRLAVWLGPESMVVRSKAIIFADSDTSETKDWTWDERCIGARIDVITYYDTNFAVIGCERYYNGSVRAKSRQVKENNT